MARDIDDDVQTQLESPGRSEIVLCFLTVTDPERDGPARIVCEENGNISFANGLGINYYLDDDLYFAIPYKFSRLSDDDRPSRATLTVPAYHRLILQWFKEMRNPARLKFEAYAAGAWDDDVDASDNNSRSPTTTPNLIYSADLMWLRNVDAGGTQISCEIGGYDFTQEPLGYRVTKELCPDLFR